MQLTKNGLTFHVEDQEAARIVLERLNGVEIAGDVVHVPAPASALGVMPRIGAEVAEWGGIFAGVSRASSPEDADYYLIVGPEIDGTKTWQDAKDAAEHLGFGDFTLPVRKEQALLFANVAELFKAEWYWSSEQHASSSNDAWA